MADHPDPGYAKLKAKADAVNEQNKKALAERLAAREAQEEAAAKKAPKDAAKAAKK